MGIKKYVKDFSPGEEGYEYTGKWYFLPGMGGEIKKQALLSAAGLALITLLFFLGLTRNNAGGYIFWILLPYMCQFLPAAYGWMGACTLWRSVFAGRKPGAEERRRGQVRTETEKQRFADDVPGIWLRQMDYDKSIRRLWRCSLGLTILSGCSAAADVLLVLPKLAEMVKADELFFLSVVCAGFAVSLLLTLHSRRLLRKTMDFHILSEHEKN